jgi:outer membrane protein assembly factor BamB
MRTRRAWALLVGVTAAAVLVVGLAGAGDGADAPGGPAQTAADEPAADDAGGGSTGAASAEATTGAIPEASTTTSTTEPFVPRTDVLVDPASFGRPWGDEVQGLLTFRGNPTRSFHGTGPVPRTPPQVLWQYPPPGRPMCGESSEYQQVRTWCGTGWTGQPAVFEREGRTWVVFGAYDYGVHFVDAATGAAILPPFMTGDLAKGNVTVDPDGYPLVYVGSRDNELRILAFDGPEPRELWSVNGQTDDRRWNNDWDGAPLVVNGHLVVGGENSWFYGFELNRSYGPDARVTVAPELVFRVPGFDDRLLADLGDNRVSLEASVSMSGDIAYLNSSGGLLQGWDLSPLRTGQGSVERVFRFWTGDDSDATVVTDDEGLLYVGVEVDRDTARVREVGQLLKIDPRLDDPVVWSVDVYGGPDSGTWSTPAVVDDLVVWPTKPGTVYGLDRATGAIRWRLNLPWGMLSSPAVVDDVLVIGDAQGTLHAWDVSDRTSPPVPLWEVPLGANIESTPAVWEGRIYVGTREGYVYAVGVPGS